jgi:hypothetical protein
VYIFRWQLINVSDAYYSFILVYFLVESLLLSSQNVLGSAKYLSIQKRFGCPIFILFIVVFEEVFKEMYEAVTIFLQPHIGVLMCLL